MSAAEEELTKLSFHDFNKRRKIYNSNKHSQEVFLGISDKKRFLSIIKEVKNIIKISL